MLKLVPDMRRFVAWAHQHRLVERGGDLSYAIHAALTNAFGEHAPKPFRLYEQTGGGGEFAPSSVLYGYTAAEAPALLDHARTFADPEVAQAFNLDRLAVKAMPDAWEPTRRLGFEVRVRPVLRRDHPGDREKARERDVFQVAWEDAASSGDIVDPPHRESIYRAWLDGHVTRSRGARLVSDSVRLVAFQRLRVARRGREARDGHRRLVSCEGPDAILAGVLEVADGPAFTSLLRRGIGRHRAFGFGMLLLRPAASRSRC